MTGDPARGGEEILRILQHRSMTTKQLDLLVQRLWDRHFPAILPEWRVGALARLVVQDDAVPGATVLIRHVAVVSLDAEPALAPVENATPAAIAAKPADV
jgi:hypothetical protein